MSSVDDGPTWDDLAPDWDTDPGPRAYAAAAYASLVEALNAGPGLAGARALDFGCGTGLLTERLATVCGAVDATDVSPAMLRVLREKIGRQGWAHVRALAEPPGPPAAYDLVVASSVCGFLDDYPAAVGRLTALLAPGGAFVQWDWERDPDDPGGHGLSRGEIADALGAAGLERVEVGTAFTIDVEGSEARPLRGVGWRPRDSRARLA